MPIVGEQVFWIDLTNLDPNYVTYSYQVNMPPSSVFAKVHLHRVQEYGYPDWTKPGRVKVFTLLFNIRRRRPDGTDEQINFPTTGRMVVADYEDKMTSVTFGAIYGSAATEISLVLEYWS
jgi:hypothetical protein